MSDQDESKLPDFNFLDDVDEENVTQEIWRSLNKLYSHVSHLVNYKYHLILYRLVKRGIKMEDLVYATGYSRQRIYKIVEDFEKRELERVGENEQTNPNNSPG